MTIQVGKPGLNSKAAGSESVRTAILSSRMDGIAQKMQNTLFRTARSGVLNTAHDFSCVILTPDCRLLARARKPADPYLDRPGPDVSDGEALPS
jgi:N-methylhydantoinase B